VLALVCLVAMRVREQH